MFASKSELIHSLHHDFETLPFLRLSSRLGLAVVMLATCVSNSVSAYGALELRSEILQQNFLTVDISKVLNKYIEAINQINLASFH